MRAGLVIATALARFHSQIFTAKRCELDLGESSFEPTRYPLYVDGFGLLWILLGDRQIAGLSLTYLEQQSRRHSHKDRCDPFCSLRANY